MLYRLQNKRAAAASHSDMLDRGRKTEVASYAVSNLLGRQMQSGEHRAMGIMNGLPVIDAAAVPMHQDHRRAAVTCNAAGHLCLVSQQVCTRVRCGTGG
jgi:hypothetical protein